MTPLERATLANAAAVMPSRFLAGVADGWARDLLLRQLKSFLHGRLTLVDGSSAVTAGTSESASALAATITVHDPSFYSDVAFGGSLGAAHSYLAGRWDCDDLTALFQIFLRNLAVMDGLEKSAAMERLAAKGFEWLHRNTVSGSRDNIHAHYDLGNEFFRLFLDPTLSYSSAWFESDQSTLEEASIAKVDRLCRKLDLRPSDHLLEIGTGWGYFAIHAARHFGCRVTTTTISREQFDLASDRVRAEGLAGRITVLLEDYRSLTGTYSKLVSVEMIEAVGRGFLGEFFARCSRLLAPNGLMALQGIFMAEHRYAQYCRQVDFISRYVFPGSHLPSMKACLDAVAERTDLSLLDMDDMTPHYARTLREWRSAFQSRIADVRALGFPPRFERLWEYYFCYCIAGFEERNTRSVQLVLAKPGNRRAPIVGM